MFRLDRFRGRGAMNPYGLLPRGGSIWVAADAANDLFRIDQATGCAARPVGFGEK